MLRLLAGMLLLTSLLSICAAQSGHFHFTQARKGHSPQKREEV